MKKLLALLALLTCIVNTKAQNTVTISDTSFANWLQLNIPSAMIGNQMDTTNSAVTSLKTMIIQNKDIVSLDGIQYFDSLKMLDCSNTLFDTILIRIITIPALPTMLDTFICNNNSLSALPELPENLVFLQCNFNPLSHLPLLPASLRTIECLNDSLIIIPTLPDSLIIFDCSNNFIDSLPALPANLITLHCKGNRLFTLPLLPDSLSTLLCDFNQMQNLPSLPGSLSTLHCTHNNLTALPNLPNGLIYMDCSYNQINTLPSLPPSLPNLFCNNNQLTTLSALPNSIAFIDCSFNQINVLPILPNALIKLNCSYNELPALPSLSNTLEILYCQSNQLQALPNLPLSLHDLNCGFNLLPVLPSLPNLLYTLLCNDNQLNALPTLPLALNVLDCSVNQINNLPTLPNSLTVLNCSTNDLNNLPVLSTSLSNLNCNFNSIVSLPSMPASLNVLDCSGNKLNVLPFLPLNLNQLACSNNNIHCFDPFGNISYLDISNNPFTCIPNYIPVMDPATLNVPLCLAGNPFGCASTFGIVGFTYKDSNNNCLKDSGDGGLKNIPMKIYSSSVLKKTSYTASNGVYQFLDSGAVYKVEVDTIGKPFEAACIFPGLDSTVTVAMLDTNVNFALTCKAGFDIGVQSIWHCGLAFPGQIHTLNINAGDISNWYNLSCATGISGTVKIEVIGPVIYLGPAPGALTPVVSGNVFTYNISDFGNIQNSTSFNILLQPYTTAQDGDPICVTVNMTPVGGDNNSTNNNYTSCYTIVNSHDPNIKEVYPVDVIHTFHDWFTYTIYFQNTGSAPAFNIRLADTLDQDLDLSTFQVTNYSHENTTTLNGNIISVHYPNIQLPDSASNPEGSIGFIQYRLKPKTTWPDARRIKNTAYIYFDFNAPIVTNSTYNAQMKSTGLENKYESLVGLYPNPSNGTFTIELNTKEKQTIRVFDMTGNCVISQTMESGKTTVNAGHLAAGIYNINIVVDGAVMNKKLVIVK
ncbi:MAG: T9SS type A sorting domain-containing protein [Bacteroidota bacterium]